MPQSSMVTRVLTFVEHNLILGRWSPGEQLSLRPVAKELDVSLTPVRDAFSILATQGVLEQDSSGTRVPRYSPRQLERLIELRATLEGLAARWLAIGSSQASAMILAPKAEEVEELVERELGQLSGSEANIENDSFWVKAADAEEQFHRQLVECTGVRALVVACRACSPMVLQAIVVPHLGERRYLLAEHHYSHFKVVDAIASGDADIAEATAREHVMSGWRQAVTTTEAVDHPVPGATASGGEKC